MDSGFRAAVERNPLLATQVFENVAAGRVGHAGIDRRLDVLGEARPDTGGAGHVADLAVKSRGPGAPTSRPGTSGLGRVAGGDDVLFDRGHRLEPSAETALA